MELRDEALDRWPELLEAAGIDPSFLRKQHGPCPCCGGKDRFRFDNKGGMGTFFCSFCGAGDGMKLLMLYRNCDFAEGAKFVRDKLGNLPVEAVHRTPRQQISSTQRDEEHIRASLEKVSFACHRVLPGDAVWRYLKGYRGLDLPEIPKAIKLHPNLGYYEEGGDGKMTKVGEFPAMIATVRAPDGRAVSLHRTYLARQGEGKAPVECPKKLMTGFGLTGGAIRLFPAGKVLAVAEGIETALAVNCLTGYPVWATVSSTMMQSLVVPEYVEHLLIFADNDVPDQKGRRAGQEAAELLKSRMEKEGRKVGIVLPRNPGTDFADVWLERRNMNGRIAA